MALQHLTWKSQGNNEQNKNEVTVRSVKGFQGVALSSMREEHLIGSPYPLNVIRKHKVNFLFYQDKPHLDLTFTFGKPETRILHVAEMGVVVMGGGALKRF